jgi:serine/threonine protein kinase
MSAAMADDFDVDPNELLNRRIAASLGDGGSSSEEEAAPVVEIDPEEFKRQEIEKMIKAGYVLAPADGSNNPQAPPARAPPLPPRKIIAPKEVFETKIEYDASHFWKDSRPDTPQLDDENDVSVNFEGTQVASKYDVGSQLGSGNTSLVYAAKRKSDGVDVAIKAITARTAPQVPQTQWKETGKRLTECAGKHVVALLEEIAENDGVFLVLERYDGPLLQQVWKEKKPWTEKNASAVVGQLLRAIRRVHKKGYIHGDVSPGNILSKGDLTEVALSGFTKAVHGPNANEVACPSQMRAPEMLAKVSHGKKIDSWALGCVTYLFLSGKWPFSDANRMKQNLLIQEAKVDFSDKAWSTVSDSAKEFVKSLLVLEPSKRSKVSTASEHPWIKEPPATVLEGIHDVWAKTLDFK